MRIQTISAIPAVFSNLASAPTNGTKYPIQYTLSEFVRIFWRVKRWQVGLNVTIDSDGVSENFSATVPLDDVIGAMTEEDRIPDMKALSDDLFLIGSGMKYTGSTLVPDYFTASINLIQPEAGGLSGVRAYWSGENGGQSGNVVPLLALRAQLLVFDASQSMEILFDFNTAFLPDVQVGWEDGGSGQELNAATFETKQFDCYWRANIPEGKLPISVTALDFDFSPLEWFPFAEPSGANPIWNSVTGEQLLDPLKQTQSF